MQGGEVHPWGRGTPVRARAGWLLWILLGIILPPFHTFSSLQVHAWGIDVNSDVALWGPMYGCTALSLLYCLCLALSASWPQVGVEGMAEVCGGGRGRRGTICLSGAEK